MQPSRIAPFPQISQQCRQDDGQADQYQQRHAQPAALRSVGQAVHREEDDIEREIHCHKAHCQQPHALLEITKRDERQPYQYRGVGGDADRLGLIGGGVKDDVDDLHEGKRDLYQEDGGSTALWHGAVPFLARHSDETYSQCSESAQQAQMPRHAVDRLIVGWPDPHARERPRL
jgi:hypothetical protein